MKEIQKWAEQTKCYLEGYCDAPLCTECPSLNKLVKFEYYKRNNICPKCFGFGSICYHNNYSNFTHRTCNQCGGTGNFF